MARQAKTAKTGEVVLDFGDMNPKQVLFCKSRSRYTAYGGARGGGKSHVMRLKSVGGAMNYAGIKILIVRKTYPDLENSIIEPITKMVPSSVGEYNGSMHTMYFVNGSTIKFGHYSSKEDDMEYQGQEYDWIFIDEATQFTESMFRTLGACLRGTSDIPRRMYLTCNPGGIGHMWVKRLFVDREYYAEKGEKAEDYTFIPATVEDNSILMEKSPEYLQMLDLLPEDIRRAHRYGDWDALAGQYFPEFKKDVHGFAPFTIPREWPKYRVFDYGLDMFACLWVAVDYDGRCWVYREVQESGKIVSEAADMMNELTPPEEHIIFTIAPPDMWNRQKDTGRTMAEVFTSHGVGLVKASNNRVQGWLTLKEYLKKPADDVKPMLMVSEDCWNLWQCLPALQHSDKNASDAATEPHDITHITDALRYFIAFRTLGAIRPEVVVPPDDGDAEEDYDELMTGGEISNDYMFFEG